MASTALLPKLYHELTHGKIIRHILTEKEGVYKTAGLDSSKMPKERKEEEGSFPSGTVAKNSPISTGDTGLIPGPGRPHVRLSN